MSQKLTFSLILITLGVILLETVSSASPASCTDDGAIDNGIPALFYQVKSENACGEE